MMNQTALHAIKYEIFERLRTNSAGLRYTQMRPEAVENDVFNYHLRQLVRQGLVQKFRDTYELTPVGKAFLHDLNPVDAHGQSERFKMAALLLVTRAGRTGVDVLIQRRTRQPFAGETGLIGGGIRRGESAVAAAERRLAEEAGLTGSFNVVGTVRKIKFDRAGTLYSDILFHVCLARKVAGELVEENRYGQQLWVSAQTASTAERAKADGSVRIAQLLDDLADRSLEIPLFYSEQTYTLDPA